MLRFFQQLPAAHPPGPVSPWAQTRHRPHLPSPHRRVCHIRPSHRSPRLDVRVFLSFHLTNSTHSSKSQLGREFMHFQAFPGALGWRVPLFPSLPEAALGTHPFPCFIPVRPRPNTVLEGRGRVQVLCKSALQPPPSCTVAEAKEIHAVLQVNE